MLELGHVCGLFTKEMTLVFVCPVTMRPLLPCGTPQVARVALAAYGIPLPLSIPSSLLERTRESVDGCMDRTEEELSNICNAEGVPVKELLLQQQRQHSQRHGQVRHLTISLHLRLD